jgi:hypothetical protein
MDNPLKFKKLSDAIISKLSKPIADMVHWDEPHIRNLFNENIRVSTAGSAIYSTMASDIAQFVHRAHQDRQTAKMLTDSIKSIIVATNYDEFERAIAAQRMYWSVNEMDELINVVPGYDRRHLTAREQYEYTHRAAVANHTSPNASTIQQMAKYITIPKAQDFENFMNEMGLPSSLIQNEKGNVTMLKAMISQPMNGYTDDQVTAIRAKAVDVMHAKGYGVVDTFFKDDWADSDKLAEKGIEQVPLLFMSKSLEKMAECHAVYFCKGWEEARGCRIEHQVAEAYGLTIFEEE